ncbi:hypothetical protein C8R44DRAFT_871355 [Mycena epipterygia]|nr:hypothetical protein C8R44DRAFT_871355 [Mycena epipterygia]
MQIFPTAALLVLGALASSVLGQEDMDIAGRAALLAPTLPVIKPPVTTVIKPPVTTVIKPPVTTVIKPPPLPTPHCPPLPCRPLVERRACVQGRCVDVDRRIELQCLEEDIAILCPE